MNDKDAMPKKEPKHCPRCGYTEADKRLHGDHHLCDQRHKALKRLKIRPHRLPPDDPKPKTWKKPDAMSPGLLATIVDLLDCDGELDIEYVKHLLTEVRRSRNAEATLEAEVELLIGTTNDALAEVERLTARVHELCKHHPDYCVGDSALVTKLRAELAECKEFRIQDVAKVSEERDALRAQVKRLEVLVEVDTEAMKLGRARVAALVAAFRKHAYHEDDCPAHLDNEGVTCTCGFQEDAALVAGEVKP